MMGRKGCTYLFISLQVARMIVFLSDRFQPEKKTREPSELLRGSEVPRSCQEGKSTRWAFRIQL